MHKLMETKNDYKFTDYLRFPWKPFWSLQISSATKITKTMILTGTPN